MISLIMNRQQLQRILLAALEEDIQTGDVTSELLPADLNTTAHIVAKQNGIVAGMAVARLTFELIDPNIVFHAWVEDGEAVTKGQRIGVVSGNARYVLTAERTALNFMQRMSGIATKTRKFMDEIEKSGNDAVILDTRKTAPGMRITDKWAVRLGGGQNHRMGLYDMILIKENHIAAAGSIEAVLKQAMKIKNTQHIPVEIEVKNLDELRQVLQFDVDRIMLDNMTLDEMKEAVGITDGRIALEASGNVKLKTVRKIAETGVDFISSGALTHSVSALDISLLHESLKPQKVRG